MRELNSGVRLVLYSSGNDRDAQAIVEAASRYFPPSQVVRCSSAGEVGNALREVLSGYGIVLLLIRDQEEIFQMIGLGDRLRDHAVMMILEDASGEMTHQALKLYPRFTGTFQDGEKDILMVLEKMIQKIEATIKEGKNG